MNDIHPHWHTSDSSGPSDPVIVPVHDTKEETPTQTQNVLLVSRMPGAIAGIALTLAIGFAGVRGWELFQGQVTASGETHIIHITDAGMDPPLTEAHTGDSVTFINDLKSSVILRSNTLQDANGNMVLTPAISPNASYTFTIFAQGREITHTFTTLSEPLLTGQIAVSGVVSSEAQSSSEASSIESSSSSQAAVIPEVPAAPITEEPIVRETNTTPLNQPTVGGNAIPVNPYTVGTVVGTSFSSAKPASTGTHTTPTHSGPHPLQQPESGPNVWMLCAVGALMLLLLLQRFAGRVYAQEK